MKPIAGGIAQVIEDIGGAAHGTERGERQQGPLQHRALEKAGGEERRRDYQQVLGPLLGAKEEDQAPQGAGQARRLIRQAPAARDQGGRLQLV